MTNDVNILLSLNERLTAITTALSNTTVNSQVVEKTSYHLNLYLVDTILKLNVTYTKRSEDIQEVFWTPYVRSIYICVQTKYFRWPYFFT